MMAGMARAARKAVAAGAALCLALGLCACADVTRDKSFSEPNDADGVGMEETERLQGLLNALPDSYACNTTERYVIGEGDTVQEGVLNSETVADNTDGAGLVYIKYEGDWEEKNGVELYAEGEKTVQVSEGGAIDVSSINPAAGGEGWQPVGGWQEIYWRYDTLVSVEEDGEDTVFHLRFGGEFPGAVGLVEKPTEIEVSCRFNAMGTLVGETVTAKGAAEVGGQSVPARTAIETTYHNWGNVTVPPMPDDEGVLVTSDVAQASAELRERLEGLPANMTVGTETTVTTAVGGQEETATVYAEALVDRTDGFKAAMYLELNGDEDNATLTIFDGDQSQVIQGDEVVGESQTGVPDDPAGIEKALALLDCAGSIDVYEYDDGAIEYVLNTDPTKVPSGLFDGMESIGSLIASYYFDGEGVIQGVVMRIKGTPAGGGAGDAIAMETNAFYYDLGTTEVPPLL